MADEYQRPDPRRCDTPENVCGRGVVEPVLVTDRRGLHQSDGYKPTWIFLPLRLETVGVGIFI